MSDSAAARIIPGGSISLGCKYTAATSMPLRLFGLPIGNSLAAIGLTAKTMADAMAITVAYIGRLMSHSPLLLLGDTRGMLRCHQAKTACECVQQEHWLGHDRCCSPDCR